MPKGKDYDMNGNGCTRKLWNVKIGIIQSGVTIWEKAEKEQIEHILEKKNAKFDYMAGKFT